MAKSNKFIINTFMCIQCGQVALTLPRQVNHQHKRFHRKKIYCPHCRTEINCVECKNDEEVFIFKQDFEDGLFKEECEASLDFIGKKVI